MPETEIEAKLGRFHTHLKESYSEGVSYKYFLQMRKLTPQNTRMAHQALDPQATLLPSSSI